MFDLPDLTPQCRKIPFMWLIISLSCSNRAVLYIEHISPRLFNTRPFPTLSPPPLSPLGKKSPPSTSPCAGTFTWCSAIQTWQSDSEVNESGFLLTINSRPNFGELKPEPAAPHLLSLFRAASHLQATQPQTPHASPGPSIPTAGPDPQRRVHVQPTVGDALTAAGIGSYHLSSTTSCYILFSL